MVPAIFGNENIRKKFGYAREREREIELREEELTSFPNSLSIQVDSILRKYIQLRLRDLNFESLPYEILLSMQAICTYVNKK